MVFLPNQNVGLQLRTVLCVGIGLQYIAMFKQAPSRHIEHIATATKFSNKDGGVSVFICISNLYLPRDNLNMFT